MSWAHEAKQRGDLGRVEATRRRRIIAERDTYVESAWEAFDSERVQLTTRERRARAEAQALEAAKIAAAERIVAARRRVEREEQKARVVLREIVNRAYRELVQVERESLARIVGGNSGAANYRPSPMARRRGLESAVATSPRRTRHTADSALRALAASLQPRVDSDAASPVPIAARGEFRYVLAGTAPMVHSPPNALTASGVHGASALASSGHASTSEWSCAQQAPARDVAPSSAVLMFVATEDSNSQSEVYPRAAASRRLDATQRLCDAAVARFEHQGAACRLLQRVGRGMIARSAPVQFSAIVSSATSPRAEGRRNEARADGRPAGASVAAAVALRQFERDFTIPSPTVLRKHAEVDYERLELTRRRQRKSAHSPNAPAVAKIVREDDTVRRGAERAASAAATSVGHRPMAVIADPALREALSKTQVGKSGSCQPAGPHEGELENANGDSVSDLFALGSSLPPLEPDIDEFVDRLMRMTPAERSYHRQERRRLMDQRQRLVDTDVFDRANALKQAEAAACVAKTQSNRRSAARLDAYRLLRARRRLEETRTKAAESAAVERAKFLEHEAVEQRAVARHVQLRAEILNEGPEVALRHTAAHYPGADKHMSAVQRELATSLTSVAQQRLEASLRGDGRPVVRDRLLGAIRRAESQQSSQRRVIQRSSSTPEPAKRSSSSTAFVSVPGPSNK